MLIAYLSTLVFIFMMSIAYGIYKLAFRLIDGHSFFVPNKEKLEKQSFIDELWTADKSADQMPDNNESADNLDDESEELYGMPEELINPELVEKNRLYDEKIQRMKAELDAYQNPEQFILDENLQRVGVVFDEDHVEVDKRYIPKPTHEYTDQGWYKWWMGVLRFN